MPLLPKSLRQLSHCIQALTCRPDADVPCELSVPQGAPGLSLKSPAMVILQHTVMQTPVQLVSSMLKKP